ncbi:MAG TPA: endo alpha-1,4 polygalactosaminidase [Chloroflexia bacterium]|nr:endo alpha-1,4 polygalactosaminidase [Chloroflexia bacterium]
MLRALTCIAVALVGLLALGYAAAGAGTRAAAPAAPQDTGTPSPTTTPACVFVVAGALTSTGPGCGPPTLTPTPSSTPCVLSFSDVHAGDYFYTPVLYLACHGAISGYGDGTFAPYSPTTRAQMVKIVVGGFAIPQTTPAGGNYTFADAPPANPFFAVIETAAAHNLVSGYACGGSGEPCDSANRPYFHPYADVTRGQLSKIIAVGAGWALAAPPQVDFADVPAGSAFYAFVEAAYCRGVISGYSCGGPGEPCDNQDRPYLRPGTTATRGQIAKIAYGAITGGAPCVYPTPVPTHTPAPMTPTPARWQPALHTSWQWQLTNTPIDQTVDAQMYDIDLFDNDASVVAALHARGRKVVCYINVGAWENWRPDAGQFPPALLGQDYIGWPGEKWLDIRQIATLGPLMQRRLDACQAAGFDGIEPDNIDGYTAPTGFPLTYQDQITYNTWLAHEAHARGLAIGLKNDIEQVGDLLPYFDWALSEDCFAQGWCGQLAPFVQAGKAVFAAEYTDMGVTTDQFCPAAATWHINGIIKNRNLDAWRAACP